MNNMYNVIHAKCIKYRKEGICTYITCNEETINKYCDKHFPKKKYIEYCDIHGELIETCIGRYT